MKAKTILIISIVLILCTLTACAGAGDWAYDKLPADYEVWRINSEEKVLGRRDGAVLSHSIDESISEFCYNDSFIAVKAAGDYYIVRVKDDTVIGPLTEDEYIALHLDNMCDWISTDRMPDGAHN